MNLLALASIVGIILAAEPIVSPLPNNFTDAKPTRSFAEISKSGVVLGAGLEDITTPALTSMSNLTNLPEISPKEIDAPVLATPPTELSSVTGKLNAPTELSSVTGKLSLPTPTPTRTVTPTPNPTELSLPTPIAAHVPKRTAVTIAFLGDSMIDTLGPGFPAFHDALNKSYSGINATILNYGVGGTNIEYGIERITNGYEYLGQHIPSLASQHPDIVVIESFGYNPFPIASHEDAINRHWMDMAKAVDTLRSTIPGVKIMIAATIAPNAKVFGDGAAGLSFSAIDKWQRVDNIKSYLESTTKFAKGEHIPLADAYHPSLRGDGNGELSYINAGDHIHYSDAGRAFFAQKVLETLLGTGWL